MIITGLLALFVSLGNFAKWAPWSLLHRLPFMSSTRVSSRFIIISVFVIAILAGLVLELFYREVKQSSKAKYFFIAIIIFIILDLLTVNTKPFNNVFPNYPSEVSPGDVFHQMKDFDVGRSGAYSSIYLNLLANTGTLNAYDAVPNKVFAKSFNDSEYKGEVYLDGNGTASYAYWSPNKLIVNINIENESRLIMNQNYDAGWRIKGKVAESFKGLLSTNVTPSDKTVEFYYLPTAFIIGLTMTLVSIIIVVFSFRYFKS